MDSPSEWNGSIIEDERMPSASDVFVRSIEEVVTGRKRLIDEVYFEGLDVLRCYEGKFRFSFVDRETVELNAGEVLVIYPRHKVTIDAMAKTNRLVYGIFGGKDVESYFDRIGYFDCAKGVTLAHYESIVELRRQFTCNGMNVEHRRHCLAFLTDILVTQWMEMRSGSHALAFDAVKLIHQNLLKRQVRLEPLCEQLGVCRSYLHRVFLQAGLESPSAFIRNRQLRMAESLLINTRLAIGDISDQSGFLSVSHFTTFFKRMTGKTPTQFRNSPMPFIRDLSTNRKFCGQKTN